MFHSGTVDVGNMPNEQIPFSFSLNRVSADATVTVVPPGGCSDKEESENSSFDSQSSSIIKLNNATILYLREVTRYLAVVCILREDSFERQGTAGGATWWQPDELAHS